MKIQIDMKKILLIGLLIFVCIASKPRKIRWVAIGDSITYLNDHVDETEHRLTKGFLKIITEQYPQVEYINQGHNGWTSVNIASRIDSIGLTKADVYTIFLGTNDWWQGKPVGVWNDFKKNTGTGTVYGSFRIIIDKVKTLNKKAQIILITPMQRGDFVYINNPKNNAYGSYKSKNDQTLEQFANAISDIAKHEKLAVVDLYHDSGIDLDNMVHFKRLKDPATGNYRNFYYPEYTEIKFNPERDDYPYPTDAINMTYDGLHPSDKGNQIIAKMILEKWKGLK
tara:strand:+ start:739 stop:1584 length:846 start_codon:yes stop_codon:yes gene_type:complete